MIIPIVISSIKNDSDRAFMTRLYMDYYALMRKHAIGVLKGTQDVDDVINDACVKLINKVKLLQTLESCALAAYIVYTIRTVAIDFIKRRDVRSKHTFLGMEEDALDEIERVDDGSDIEQQVVDKETAKSTVSLLKQLPEKERILLECKYVLDMNDKDIASLLGIKPQSVRQYLTRARRNAIEILKKGGVENASDI